MTLSRSLSTKEKVILGVITSYNYEPFCRQRTNRMELCVCAKCKTSFQNKLMAGSLVKIYAVENAYGVI